MSEIDMVEVSARVQNLEKINTEFEAMKSKMAEMDETKKKEEEAAKAALAKAEEEKKDKDDKMANKGVKAKIAAIMKAMEEPDEEKKAMGHNQSQLTKRAARKGRRTILHSYLQHLL